MTAPQLKIAPWALGQMQERYTMAEKCQRALISDFAAQDAHIQSAYKNAIEVAMILDPNAS